MGLMTNAPDIRIDGLSFEGFDAGFADRATTALEQALAEGAQGLSLTATHDIASLDLNDLDFASPDALGRGLAAAILRALA